MNIENRYGIVFSVLYVNADSISDEFFKDHTEDGMISENGMKFKYPTLSNSNYE